MFIVEHRQRQRRIAHQRGAGAMSRRDDRIDRIAAGGFAKFGQQPAPDAIDIVMRIGWHIEHAIGTPPRWSRTANLTLVLPTSSTASLRMRRFSPDGTSAAAG